MNAPDESDDDYDNEINAGDEESANAPGAYADREDCPSGYEHGRDGTCRPLAIYAASSEIPNPWLDGVAFGPNGEYPGPRYPHDSIMSDSAPILPGDEEYDNVQPNTQNEPPYHDNGIQSWVKPEPAKPASPYSGVSTFNEYIAPVQAVAHFAGRSAEPMQVPFERIDTQHVRPYNFPGVAKVLKDGPDRVAIPIDTTLPYQTPGMEAAYLGNITLRLQGHVYKDPDNRRWQFVGNVGSYDDVYDFNKSTHRTKQGELSTGIGSYIPGVPYNVKIYGKKHINETYEY